MTVGVGVAFVVGFFCGAVVLMLASMLAVAGEPEAPREDPRNG